MKSKIEKETFLRFCNRLITDSNSWASWFAEYKYKQKERASNMASTLLFCMMSHTMQFRNPHKQIPTFTQYIYKFDGFQSTKQRST